MDHSLNHALDIDDGAPREALWRRLNPLRHFAAALGWASGRVHSEMFPAASAAEARPFAVHLRRSGRVVQVGRDASILDALLAEGVPVLWDCRRGECGLCAQNVVSAEGGIEHRDRYLTDEEKASGETLCICVSRARGSTLVLDA